MFISLFRALRLALQNFWRNIWLSVVTILILLLTLFSIAFSYGLNLVATRAVALVKEKVDVSIYFSEQATDEEVQRVQTALVSLPEVERVTYISKDEALRAFRERNAKNPIITETLDVLGRNPLGPTLVVKAKRIEDFPAILGTLEKQEYESFIQDQDFAENEKVIARLSDISKRIGQVGLLISVVFSVIALLVMFNAIRITIYTYREEIGIMKLVGASNWFVRAPFIIESIIYALIASVLSMALFIPLIGVSAPFFNNFFAGYDFDLLEYFGSHLWPLFGIQVLIGVVFAIISSSIAMTRYLRR